MFYERLYFEYFVYILREPHTGLVWNFLHSLELVVILLLQLLECSKGHHSQLFRKVIFLLKYSKLIHKTRLFSQDVGIKASKLERVSYRITSTYEYYNFYIQETIKTITNLLELINLAYFLNTKWHTKLFAFPHINNKHMKMKIKEKL